MDIGSEMRVIEVDEPAPEPMPVESIEANETNEMTPDRTDTYPKAI